MGVSRSRARQGRLRAPMGETLLCFWQDFGLAPVNSQCFPLSSFQWQHCDFPLKLAGLPKRVREQQPKVSLLLKTGRDVCAPGLLSPRKRSRAPGLQFSEGAGDRMELGPVASQLFLKCVWLNKSLNKFCKALFPFILSPSEFQGEFSPCASDSLQVNHRDAVSGAFDVPRRPPFTGHRSLFSTWRQEVAARQRVMNVNPRDDAASQPVPTSVARDGVARSLGQWAGCGSGGWVLAGTAPPPPPPRALVLRQQSPYGCFLKTVVEDT